MLVNEAAGLLAISKRLSLNFEDHHEMLRHGMVIYDVLYAWCADTPAEEDRTGCTSTMSKCCIPPIWKEMERRNQMTSLRTLSLWIAIFMMPALALAGQGVHENNWTFDDVEKGMLPEGWKVEGTNQRGPVAAWAVREDASAPSKPNVLALMDTKQGWGGTYNLLWTNRVQFRDGVMEVKVKAEAGGEDQGGGPIWRVQDKDNYYIARWNPLEDNFRVYYVKDGSRKTLESTRVKADPSKWHIIRIEHKGNEIRCYFDGEALKTIRDKTFPDAGGVGLWTKADAATAFDDLVVTGSGPSSGE